jgi:hypothetical protein
VQEVCSCGAAIRTMFYKRALMWRLTHQHGQTETHELLSDTFPVGFTLPDTEEEPSE